MMTKQEVDALLRHPDLIVQMPVSPGLVTFADLAAIVGRLRVGGKTWDRAKWIMSGYAYSLVLDAVARYYASHKGEARRQLLVDRNLIGFEMEVNPHARGHHCELVLADVACVPFVNLQVKDVSGWEMSSFVGLAVIEERRIDVDEPTLVARGR